MACLNENLIRDLLHGCLDPAALAQVEEHLDVCAACKQLMDRALLAEPSRTVAAWSRDRGAAAGLSPGVASIAPLARGTSVGRYIVLSLLGRGGMGEVYAAYDPDLDRKVAVKVLHMVEPSRVSPGERRERMLREAKAIARLSHPNVVVVHDAGTFNDRVFIAMELVEGETAAQWLKSHPRGWRQIRDVFAAAGSGLAAAHAMGLVHRDFKPQNVMVRRDGKVRVMDFGLVRQIVSNQDADADEGTPSAELTLMKSSSGSLSTPLTETGVLMGTPAYMAPEQFAGKPADACSDQFSFCVALFEALYGERPFRGESLEELSDAISRGHRSGSSRQLRGRVPAWLRRVVLRGLRAKAADRFASMTDLLHALQRDPARRARSILGLTAVGAVLLAAGLTVQQASHRTSALCRAGETKIAHVWDPRAKVAVRRAFLATGKSYASNALAGVTRALDDYVTKWSAMYTDACEAAHVRGDQSTEVLDLRMICLDDCLREAQALTELFTRADGKVVEQSLSAVHALRPIDPCGDVRALRTGVQPPKDPIVRRGLESLRPRLAAVKALYDGGHYVEAKSAGAKLVSDARNLGFEPFLAEVLYQAGSIDVQTAVPSVAEETFHQALLVAEKSRHDYIAVAAASYVAFVVGCLRGDHDTAVRWSNLARAILVRMGGDDRLEAWVMNDLAGVQLMHGDYKVALDNIRRAVALKETTVGSDDPDLAISLAPMAMVLAKLERYQEAQTVNERAYDIMMKAHGPEHPAIANVLDNRAALLLALNQLDEARSTYEKTLRIMQAELSSETPMLIPPLTGMGETHLALGDPEAAIPFLEAALKIGEANVMSPLPLAEARFPLARALWESKRDRRRALRLAAAARADYQRVGTLPKKLAEVDAWLARRERRNKN